VKTASLVLAIALCLGAGGCSLFKKAPPKISAPVSAPPPAVQPVAPPEVQPAPPPAVEPDPLPLESAPKPTAVAPEPAPPVPAPKPTVRRNPAAPPPPPPPPAATPVAPPPLGEIISPSQRRQYESDFSQGVARANAALKQASARTLNAAQHETAARIRTFLNQASAMRDNDISTALQLVRRADLLGQELLSSLK